MDPDDPYAGYVFAVTFAEGERVKEIRVSAPEDEDAEPMKFGTFAIVDHLGADIFNAAGTLTLSIEDNDAPEPFTVGFAEARFTADKSSGTAIIRLKREGGTQTMVTVDYETSDGAAVAGRDYQATSGTAAFYAGVDEAVIEVPLIDDGIASDEPRSFYVTLGGLKGDGEGLGTLTQAQAEVALTNSAAGGAANLVTLLYDGEAEDVSGSVPVAEGIITPVSDSVVTGEQVTVPEDEILRGEIAGFEPEDAAGADGDGAELMTYNYGEIRFTSASHGGSYWGDTASVAGSSHNDVTGWSGGSAYGNGWQVQGKSPASATLSPAYMTQMYTGFNGKFEYSLEYADGWTEFIYGTEFVYGTAYLVSKTAVPGFHNYGYSYSRIGDKPTYSGSTAHSPPANPTAPPGPWTGT